MRKAFATLAMACAILVARGAAAIPPPLRVTVASMRDPGNRGALVADELADRIALVPMWAVADREHVRDAERALKWTRGSDDLQELAALGKRLGAEIVIGGTLQGPTAAIEIVTPQSGQVEKLEVKAPSARADQVAAAIAKAVVEHRHADVPALLASAMEAPDGNDDAAFALYAQGREELASGQAQTAQTKLEQAAARDDRLARAWALVALAHLRRNDTAGAEKPARAALERGASVREVRLAMARVADYRDQVDAAIDAYRAVLEIAPHDAIAHSNLARLLAAKRRNHDDAAREYEAALAAEPAWPIPRFNLAISELALGRFAAAAGRLERLHQEQPESAEYAVTLARAYRLGDRPSAAEPLLRPVVTSRPTDNGARTELALALASANRADTALALLDQAPEPTALAIRTARARVLLGRGEREQAARVLAEIPADAPASARHAALRVLGVVELARGKADAAERALKAVVDDDPLDGEALYDLAVAQRLAGHDAAQALARSHQAAPHLIPAALALARLQLDAGDAKAARAVVAETIATGASDPRLDYFAGLGAWRASAYDDAIAAFTRAANSRGTIETDATYALAECLLAAGKPNESRAAAARYVAQEKRSDRAAQLERARLLAR